MTFLFSRFAGFIRETIETYPGLSSFSVAIFILFIVSATAVFSLES